MRCKTRLAAKREVAGLAESGPNWLVGGIGATLGFGADRDVARKYDLTATALENYRKDLG